MPILVGTEVRRLSQAEFGRIAYEVMQCAFQVHNEMGRFFDEKIYQREMAFRLDDARTQVPVEIAFEGFSKTYYLDLLVGDGAIFELKAVDAIAPRHRGQLLHYLMLAEAAHGKLVNFRTERVQHEFVNCTLTRAGRTAFQVDDHCWQEIEAGGLKERMIAMLRDWGVGLDNGLYEEIASYLLGREETPFGDVQICVAGRFLGTQPVRLAAPDVALRVTSLPPDNFPAFEIHLQRFLEHVALRAVQWINVTPKQVRFATVVRQ